MGNLLYKIRKQKMTVGKYKDKVVYTAVPTGRERVGHREFCEEVARATTFTGAEVEAALRLAAEVAKRHVENGESVDFGDIGTLTPTFRSHAVPKAEDFDPKRHITRPMVRLRASRRYFTITHASYERADDTPGQAPSEPAKPGDTVTAKPE